MRNKIAKLSSKRNSKQRWIFFLKESPQYLNINLASYNGFYNLTATYRIDSDIANSYETWAKMSWSFNPSFDSTFDYHATKTQMAAAVISNCDANSNRLKYIKELQRFIKVDVFGKCGQKCPDKFEATDQTGDCKEIISKKYMFYLAFENSICTDYISEKFFNILKYDIVPVVLGGGNYEYYVNILLFDLKQFCFLFFEKVVQNFLRYPSQDL
jgi:alpha-1,3-fucosyltransferase